ncbi:MAG: Uridine kinase [Watsoniomyces obsoletus]|nr:MAG: Uridine kinase [Watsoniomyces obsoletus]
MSYVTRRGLSTLIPPKIASPAGIGAVRNAVRMQRVVRFYERLPRGPAPEVKPKGLLARYQARYFGKNPSAARKTLLKSFRMNSLLMIDLALAHLIGAFMLIGYAQNYYRHLRHHKNNAH